MTLVHRGRAAITCSTPRERITFRFSQGFDETVNPMTSGSFAPFTAWPRSPPETAPMKQDKGRAQKAMDWNTGCTYLKRPRGARMRRGSPGRAFTSSF
jgi:hypothetical protein